ncbi:hypothetical protein ZWY2020_004281 [Hordeum vulgare]|nr:hypothetical protein ZWY2020_004281 [Hordeum vulgare]
MKDERGKLGSATTALTGPSRDGEEEKLTAGLLLESNHTAVTGDGGMTRLTKVGMMRTEHPVHEENVVEADDGEAGLCIYHPESVEDDDAGRYDMLKKSLVPDTREENDDLRRSS